MPAPRVITTLSSLSARTRSSEERKASHSGRFQQLRMYGRLSVMRATPASASRSRMSSGHSLMMFHVSDMRSLRAVTVLLRDAPSHVQRRRSERRAILGIAEASLTIPQRMQVSHQAVEPLLQHVSADLRGLDVGVAEQRLHDTQV